MNIGSLKQRVTLRQPLTTTDALGQPTAGWQAVATVWANVRFTNGVQAIKADSEISIAKVSVRLRYRGGLNAGLQVLHGTNVYDVKAVLPAPDRGYADLVCEVVT